MILAINYKFNNCKFQAFKNRNIKESFHEVYTLCKLRSKRIIYKCKIYEITYDVFQK